MQKRSEFDSPSNGAPGAVTWDADERGFGEFTRTGKKHPRRPAQSAFVRGPSLSLLSNDALLHDG
ncbi:MAG: hypothetical protein COS85_17260 [Armatimonadetes bacterium CG07_land_8_20_14_0_80_59_28]|nr:MAG: hypothetical protein COS85_17260 [Armatimonadetes bacterium CG07_land_8_20_14_0_80_59_28]PIY39006.1 MAG: hypothetical protein COZ05_19830 [Armatimonadetes bacterium CG_4_10_14_3_um_filter_59_10]PJB62758.1 MAG: hypothetical protein CO095_17950 [Armatimonadetes bacterium CG_4_9_14_3_um_filter_58_7]